MQNAWETFDAAPADQMADFGRSNATIAAGAGWAEQSRAMQRTWRTFDEVMANPPIRDVFLFAFFQRHSLQLLVAVDVLYPAHSL